MNHGYLVRHPAPHPTESLMGYLLRLVELNGYMSPWSILQLAGMKQSDARGTGMKVDRLANISRQPVADLRKIAFAPSEGRPRWCRLLGHDLVPSEISTTSASFCPQCVHDRGFIEAHWHLSKMVGCPIHVCKAVSHCPKCGNRISWFRPGILECKCGFGLREVTTAKISEEEAALMDVLRRKALGLPPSQMYHLSFPELELLAMDLRTILIVFQVIGRYRLIADGAAGPFDEELLVQAASRVFVQWPRNFIALLQSVGEQVTPDASASVRKQFESLFHSLFKNKTIRPRTQTDFLKDAFIDFATNHWGRGVIDRRIRRGTKDGASGRFMTQAAFAGHLGVQHRTATQFVIDQGISTKTIRCGRTSRIVVDTRGVAVCRSVPGSIVRVRDAAKLLGMSPQLLQRLRQSGLFEVNSLSPVRPGFHERDVQCFKNRLLGLAQYIGLHYPSVEYSVPLGTLLRSPHSSLEIKAGVVSWILSKEITVRCDTDGTVDGLLIDSVASTQLIAQARQAERPLMMTPAEASRALDCQASTIPGLMSQGLLEGHEAPTGVQVTAESVATFGETYCSVASIARLQHSRSRWIIRRCKERGIRLLLASTNDGNSPQAFIHTVDVPLLTASSKLSGALRRPNRDDKPQRQVSAINEANGFLGSTSSRGLGSTNTPVKSQTRIHAKGNTR